MYNTRNTRKKFYGADSKSRLGCKLTLGLWIYRLERTLYLYDSFGTGIMKSLYNCVGLTLKTNYDCDFKIGSSVSFNYQARSIQRTHLAKSYTSRIGRIILRGLIKVANDGVENVTIVFLNVVIRMKKKICKRVLCGDSFLDKNIS